MSNSIRNKFKKKMPSSVLQREYALAKDLGMREDEFLPQFSLNIFRKDSRSPFEANMPMAIPGKEGVYTAPIREAYAAILAEQSPDADPNNTTPSELLKWFSERANTALVQEYWINRALGCLFAMMRVLHPKWVPCQANLAPAMALSPYQGSMCETSGDQQLEKLKAEFLARNPVADEILKPDPDRFEKAKKRIEGKHHQDPGEGQGGGVVFSKQFIPRHPKVLDPNIEIMRRPLSDG